MAIFSIGALAGRLDLRLSDQVKCIMHNFLILNAKYKNLGIFLKSRGSCREFAEKQHHSANTAII